MEQPDHTDEWPTDPQAILNKVRNLASDERGDAWEDDWEEVPPEVELRQRREVMRSEPQHGHDTKLGPVQVTPPPAQRIGSGAGSKPKRPQIWLDMLEQLRPKHARITPESTEGADPPSSDHPDPLTPDRPANGR